MEKKNEVIIAIANAYESKNEALTNMIESIVLPNNNFAPALQERYEALGDTPQDEPKFYELIEKLDEARQSGNVEAIEDTNDEIAEYLLGDKADEFSALEIANFIDKSIAKIISYQDELGYFKTTPAVSEMKLPNTKDIKKIKKALSKENVQAEEISKLFFDIAGLKRDELTKWEANLCDTIFMEYYKAVMQSRIGVVASLTPFGKYLKN